MLASHRFEHDTETRSYMTDLVQEIQRHLDRLGWSQRDLASRAGIAHGTISKLMRDVHRPTPTTLSLIARALSVDPTHLLELAGLPVTSGTYDPEVAYIARKITELPNGVRKQAIDILGTQLDSIYEMTGQTPPPRTREPSTDYKAEMPPDVEAMLREVLGDSDKKDDVFLTLKEVYGRDPQAFKRIIDSVSGTDSDEPSDD